MKKLVLAIVASLTFAFGSGDNVITSGDNLLSVGFNISDFDDAVPGIVVAWDHGVSFAESFTFGADIYAAFYSSGVTLGPSFRAGYHPFAMPVLEGKVKISRVFNPYVTMGIGTWIWLGDEFDMGFDRINGGIGCHWIFAERVGLWGEIGSNYFVLGVGFSL